MAWDKKFVQDLQDHLTTQPFTHYITFNYKALLSGGADTRLRTLTQHVREWNRSILEVLFGKKFAKRNNDDGFMFVAFIEIGPLLAKEHVHLLAVVPSHLHGLFEQNASRLWRPKTINPSAGERRQEIRTDVKIGPIQDLIGLVRYVTKEIQGHPDRIIYSYEFRKSVA